jgi:hypothetical protein
MQGRLKFGLIVGVIGLAVNVCVAGFIGFCGPVVSLIAGGIAGYLAAREEMLPTRSDGAKAGAFAGGIAGALIILGQVIGGIGALAFLQSTGAELPFGTVPSPSADPAILTGYYLGGVGTALCFGFVGALLAAGVGAAAGYAGTTETPTSGSVQ